MIRFIFRISAGKFLLWQQQSNSKCLAQFQWGTKETISFVRALRFLRGNFLYGQGTRFIAWGILQGFPPDSVVSELTIKDCRSEKRQRTAPLPNPPGGGGRLVPARGPRPRG